MSANHQKIKQIEGLIALGLTVSEALGKALGTSLAQFAAEIGARPTEVYMCFGGYPDRGYPAIRDAAAERLSVPREYLDRLIDTQTRRSTASEGAA